jgi:hypothetical protein
MWEVVPGLWPDNRETFPSRRFRRTRADYRDHLDRARLLVARHPYRVPGNSVALAALRDGAVEKIDCGWAAGHSVDHGRAMDEQCRELMSFTPNRLSKLLTRFRRWMQSRGPAPLWPENLAGITISPRIRLFKRVTPGRRPA